MDVEQLALAYSRGIDDLTQLAGDLDRMIESGNLSMVRLRVIRHTRLQVAYLRALLRTQRDEFDPDFLARMAARLASAARRSGCYPADSEPPEQVQAGNLDA